MDSAYFFFGAALHTMQDSTSPSHQGFQEWSGQESLFEKIAHAGKEVFQPGSDSELRNITKQAWEGFKNDDISAFKISCKCD